MDDLPNTYQHPLDTAQSVHIRAHKINRAIILYFLLCAFFFASRRFFSIWGVITVS